MRTYLNDQLIVVAVAVALVTASAANRGLAADAAQDRYQVAAGHYQQGRWQFAVDEFRALLAESPNSTAARQARFYLGESLVQLRRFDEAATHFHEYLGASTDAPLARKALFRAGECNYLSGRLEAAESDLNSFLKQYPKDELRAYALPYLAEVARARGRHAEAEKLFRQAIDAYPHGPLADDCRYGLARALESQPKSYDEAKRLYASLAAGESPWADDAQYALAARHYAEGSYAEATKAFEPFETKIKESPLVELARTGRDRAIAQLAVAHARDKEFDQAQRQLDLLEKRQAPADVVLKTVAQLADAALAADRSDVALPLYARLASDSNPDAERQRGLLGLAASQYKSGNLGDAAESYARFLDRFPGHSSAAEAALARGQILDQLRNHDAALAMYRRVIECPARPELRRAALSAAARLHARMNQNADAAACYKQLSSEFPKDTSADAALYEWAWVEQSRGDTEAAVALWRQLHDLQRASRFWPDSTYRLAQHALEAKDYDRAGKLATEILEAKSADDVTAYALYLQGQIAVGRQAWANVAAPLERLLADYPTHSVALAAAYWIAEADYRQQRYEEAGRRLSQLETNLEGRTEAWVAMAPLRRAQVFAQQSRWSEALELALSIEKRFPSFAQQYEVDYLIGRCLAADAKFEEARKSYQKVVHSATAGKTETAAMAQWMIGETYMHQKDYAAALREYLKVEILYAYPTWQAAALLQAAKCHEFRHEWPEADRLYSRLLEKHPTTSFVEEATGRRQHVRRQAAVASTDRDTK